MERFVGRKAYLVGVLLGMREEGMVARAWMAGRAQWIPPIEQPMQSRSSLHLPTTISAAQRYAPFTILKKQTSSIVEDDDLDNSSGEYDSQAQMWSVEWITSGNRHGDNPHDIEQCAGNHLADYGGGVSTILEVPDDASASIRLSPMLENDEVEAAHRTWNWCAHFVARYSLCPWATMSVKSPNAIRIYTVSPNDASIESRLGQILESIATHFYLSLEHRTTDIVRNDGTNAAGAADPNTAICFVVLLTPKIDLTAEMIENYATDAWWYNDFTSFYEWFANFEERWSAYDQVTLAPFHPKWTYYNGNDDDEDDNDEHSSATDMAIEKQSPYPTISMVSTTVIDKAGPAASEQIAERNEATLNQKSNENWKSIYDAAIYNRHDIEKR